MIPLSTLADIEALRETAEIECKEAAGADGQGKLPTDFWPTYSAFANTRGGYIILGLRERNERFELRDGIRQPHRLIADLFNLVNNPNKASANVLSEEDVVIVPQEGTSLVVVHVPAASRKHKPVFINGNPLRGTYRRLNDGDRLCDEETIRRLLAEQVEDSRDNRILTGYDLSDLNAESLQIFRQALSDRNPQHPFLMKQDGEFLRAIGGWRRERESGREGLTVAGLLMFGEAHSIHDEFPDYFLDFREQDPDATMQRWLHRITLDGTWSGNLYDFFRKVYRRLVEDLKVPFSLQGGIRIGETPAHVALREALINTLVHADYTGRAPIVVLKEPDKFVFRNPGWMRVPAESAIQGGESDGRNRTLQQMFLLIGAGERAGSGVPKIFSGWAEQHWKPPTLEERDAPSEQTVLTLRMADLLPARIVEELRERFGEAFESLGNTERLALATAASEDTVTHARLSTLCSEHPSDLSRALRGLVQRGFLEAQGHGRGTVYFMSGAALLTPDGVFGGPSTQDEDFQSLGTDLDRVDTDLTPLGTDLAREGTDLLPIDTDLVIAEGTDLSISGQGRQVPGLSLPLIDHLESLTPSLRESLAEIAQEVTTAKRTTPARIAEVVCKLCTGRYLALRALAALLNRSEHYLRRAVLNPLVAQGQLVRAFPASPNDPRQAYASRASIPPSNQQGEPL